MMSKESCTLLLFFFAFSTASWISNLIDPTTSSWSPIIPGATLEQSKLGFANFNGYAVAFGDFDSDKHVDIFVVTQERVNTTQQALQIFLWSPTLSQYQLLSDAQIDSNSIENVIPCDYNGDGLLDVLIQSFDGSEPLTTIHFGNLYEFTSNYTFKQSPGFSHLLLMDYNLDMKPDLFGVDSSGNRGFWVNQGDGTFSFVDFTVLGSNSDLNPICEPNSNAFVDINGDCLSDLVVFSRNETSLQNIMEIWLLNGDSVTLDREMILPEGFGQVSFADIDRDGTTDFMFPVCLPEGSCEEVNSIEIIYNVQQKYCTSITGNGNNCTDSENTCGVQLPYDLPSIVPSTSTSDVVVIDSNNFGSFTFYWKRAIVNEVPNTLHLGDYNADGYPDILMVLVNSSNTTTTQLWNSVPCTASLCGDPATNAQRRTFQRSTDATSIESISNPFSATFFDFADDGTLDMIVLTKSKIFGGDFQIYTVENFVDYGTFFLKVTGLSGLCMQWCGDPSFPDPPPIGVNQPGAVVKYVWSDDDQDKRVSIGTQLSQSGYFSLQTPYVYFGLGDTSNYIQYIYFGVPISVGKQHYQYFPDIMPNSQVACNPSPVDRPYFWKYEVYMQPSGATFWTIIACALTIVALASASFFFAFRERKQDKIEAEEKGQMLTL